jgi:hypothetical protein
MENELDEVLDILEEQVSDVEFKFKISVTQLRDLLSGKPAFITIRGKEYGLIRKEALNMIVRQQRRGDSAPPRTPDEVAAAPKRGDMTKTAELLAKAEINNRGVLSYRHLLKMLQEEGIFSPRAVYAQAMRLFKHLSEEERYELVGTGKDRLLHYIGERKPAVQSDGDSRPSALAGYNGQ